VSDPIDDKAFEEYLKRESAVSQQYSSLHEVEPPSHLDENVLAQAERAVQSQTIQKARRWKKWSVPVALAASTLIAVSIVLESGMQHEVTSSAPVATPMKAQGDTLETADANAARETDKAAAEAKRSEDLSERIVHVETLPSAPAPAIDAEAFAPDPVVAAKPERAARAPMPIEEEATAKEEAAEQGEGTSESKAPEPLAQYSIASRAAETTQSAAMRDEDRMAEPSSAASAQAKLQLTRDPEQWLRDIRELRTAGETKEADRQWKEFETAFPDYEVAENDYARPAGESRE
jgi:hypothetical protein